MRRSGRGESAMELVGFVFMPEHVHLLSVSLDSEPVDGRYLARIKQPFSKQIKEGLVGQGSRLLSKLTVRERPGKSVFGSGKKVPVSIGICFLPKRFRCPGIHPQQPG